MGTGGGAMTRDNQLSSSKVLVTMTQYLRKEMKQKALIEILENQFSSK